MLVKHRFLQWLQNPYNAKIIRCFFLLTLSKQEILLCKCKIDITLRLHEKQWCCICKQSRSGTHVILSERKTHTDK